YLSKELDYETDSHFFLQVIIKDYNNPPQNSTLFLSIDVEDKNDHSPYFQDDFVVIGIEENVPVGTPVYTFNAKDGDGSFLNSKIEYSLEISNVGENQFLIHPLYGTLTTASSLDREITCSVILTVFAEDQAINLTDHINDNSPSFMSSPLSYVMENVEMGFLVHHVIAKDPDEGRNGQVTYHILSGNENKAFVLDKITGTVTSLLWGFFLDREDISNFTLVIECHDLGSPSRSSTAQLCVTVLDENDHSPLFAETQYQISVTEDLEEGSAILDLSASDKDAGLNGEVMYSIIDDTYGNLFSVETSVMGSETSYKLVGSLVLNSALDRETATSYQLVLLASDHGMPSLNSTATILITVLDVNDNPPVFSSPEYHVHVKESIPIGTCTLLVSFPCFGFEPQTQTICPVAQPCPLPSPYNPLLLPSSGELLPLAPFAEWPPIIKALLSVERRGSCPLSQYHLRVTSQES
uniref:Cadherin domain-containing protein n=1 Tax=Ficedula albicollis TaxID=59894 RepID=A0A803W5N0_FICAL